MTASTTTDIEGLLSADPKDRRIEVALLKRVNMLSRAFANEPEGFLGLVDSGRLWREFPALDDEASPAVRRPFAEAEARSNNTMQKVQASKARVMGVLEALDPTALTAVPVQELIVRLERDADVLEAKVTALRQADEAAPT